MLAPNDKRSPAPVEKSRKARSRMIALGLIVFILTVYAVTILRIGGNIWDRT
jgi:hypothetical protein